jgi:hypothetical protein
MYFRVGLCPLKKVPAVHNLPFYQSIQREPVVAHGVVRENIFVEHFNKKLRRIFIGDRKFKHFIPLWAQIVGNGPCLETLAFNGDLHIGVRGPQYLRVVQVSCLDNANIEAPHQKSPLENKI